MYDNIYNIIFGFINKVIELITTVPICYLFYTCFVIWAIALFFKIVRS